MLIVSHIAAGAVIAKAIPNPWIAAPLAFVGHFLLDMIPHAQAPTDEGYRPNKRTYVVVSLDLIASAAFIFYFHLTGTSLVVLLGAVLPDLLDLTRYNGVFYKIFRAYYDFHDKVQKETNKPIGFVTQILLLMICIIFLNRSL